MDTPPALRLARLVDRHVQFGMERAEAWAWAAGPDESNAVAIEATRQAADRIIPCQLDTGQEYRGKGRGSWL
ncbi:hypothetical protein [Arthrobacter sp. CJ23]|uniref:hypothetical protein n=1 Tax=Arthrobacter sp. CJ23 TaxID=2972479 RepID=UPI00215D0A10|nr:hypothetical protein [Arthrobacter sp. CJ23]UVJ39111.1 hypothetical protein NVV90_18175 [Arthrobacter sp. CJ23]